MDTFSLLALGKGIEGGEEKYDGTCGTNGDKPGSGTKSVPLAR